MRLTALGCSWLVFQRQERRGRGAARCGELRGHGTSIVTAMVMNDIDRGSTLAAGR